MLPPNLASKPGCGANHVRALPACSPLYEPNVANAVGTGSFVCGEGYTYYRVGAALPSGCVQST